MMNKQNETYTQISGVVAGIVFRNEENGYSVMKIDSADGGTITAVGNLPFVSAGETLTLQGSWDTHPSYGAQFKAESIEYHLPKTESEILRFLSSGAITGIGAATAKVIVAKFGEDTFRVFEEEPIRLAQLKGISERKALAIGESFRKQTALRRLTEFFSENGLSLKYALEVYSEFGDDAPAALRDNPYLLTGERYGADFSEADELAKNLGFSGDSSERVQAAVMFELWHNAENNGHCFIPLDKLTDATARLINVDGTLVREAVDSLCDAGSVAVEMTEDAENNAAVYLTKLFLAERYVAERLSSLANTERTISYNIEQFWQELDFGIELAAAQKEAVIKSVSRGAFCLTGGPGTGKTTTVRAILSLFERMGIRTLLAAPTGRAAKRMTELTGRDAKTVHRLLVTMIDEKTGKFYFSKNETNHIDADAVILDEISMVDLELMQALLKALKPNARLIMVGDADQLPSVGAGNVLADILAAEIIPCVRLTEVFRQAAESLIIRNAHKINAGLPPEQGKKNDDFFVLTSANGETTAQLIEELCATRLPKNMNIPPDQIQVLTPTKINGTGTRALNKRLQAVMNPPDAAKREKQFGDLIFRVGDRVLQIRNNYEILWEKPDGEIGAGVFNGDVGAIVRIDAAEQIVDVEFDDKRLTSYAFEQLNELEPAFAITVHKSQGSEYRAVILALMNVPKTLLTRSVLYTAATRAKELMIIVGDERCVYSMAENNRTKKRYTALRKRLAEYSGQAAAE
ncbi:MAG: ATP-dependent RecD-like DNA helicase [Oscillospiraceae bacterium]|jgi:exodeoxyribonuclease V alpha subunit|nr:ATP-dependent RecD-like DNA helicase [Oscillospiraceae bacterium]